MIYIYDCQPLSRRREIDAFYGDRTILYLPAKVLKKKKLKKLPVYEVSSEYDWWTDTTTHTFNRIN